MDVDEARENQYAILRSPPGTGKTSRLNLIQVSLEQEQKQVVQMERIAPQGAGSAELFTDLEDLLVRAVQKSALKRKEKKEFLVF
jgi:hypothetical protein